MAPDPAWPALLDGDLAARARDAVTDIAGALADAPAPASCNVDDGSAGQALFFSYAATLCDDDAYAEIAAQRLDLAVEQLAAESLDHALLGGISGVAWAIDHLCATDGDDDPNATIDDALLGALERERWDADYDLVSGLVGVGVYAAQRVDRASGRELMTRVVGHLARKAEVRDGGLTWHTAPELLPPWQRELAPDGYVNLGLAHGIPGVIGVVAKAVRAGIAVDTGMRLLEGAVPWLLSHRLDGEDAWFPSTLSGDEVAGPARSAWCYGDPGVAPPLLMAATAADRNDWAAAAREIATGIAARSPERCGVQDAGICHGAAGLAHILHRLYRATGVVRLRDAAVAWFERTLALRVEGEGVAGFRSYWPNRDRPQWRPSAGVLTGAAGVGLTLVGALSVDEPAWDNLLLVDAPPA